MCGHSVNKTAKPFDFTFVTEKLYSIFFFNSKELLYKMHLL